MNKQRTLAVLHIVAKLTPGVLCPLAFNNQFIGLQSPATVKMLGNMNPDDNSSDFLAYCLPLPVIVS